MSIIWDLMEHGIRTKNFRETYALGSPALHLPNALEPASCLTLATLHSRVARVPRISRISSWTRSWWEAASANSRELLTHQLKEFSKEEAPLSPSSREVWRTETYKYLDEWKCRSSDCIFHFHHVHTILNARSIKRTKKWKIELFGDQYCKLWAIYSILMASPKLLCTNQSYFKPISYALFNIKHFSFFQ